MNKLVYMIGYSTSTFPGPYQI